LSATFFAAWRVDGIGGPVLFAGLPRNFAIAQLIPAVRRFQDHTELKKHETKWPAGKIYYPARNSKKIYLRLTP
jgi:hypothetical protein